MRTSKFAPAQNISLCMWFATRKKGSEISTLRPERITRIFDQIHSFIAFVESYMYSAIGEVEQRPAQGGKSHTFRIPKSGPGASIGVNVG